MLRKTYRVQSVRSVRTLPAHLYHRRDFERRKRAMRYIKEEHDYITSARRNNIMFDMVEVKELGENVYKLNMRSMPRK